MAGYPTPADGYGYGYGNDQGYVQGYGHDQGYGATPDAGWGATAFAGQDDHQDPSTYQQHQYHQQHQGYDQGYGEYAGYSEHQGEYGTYQQYAAPHADQHSEQHVGYYVDQPADQLVDQLAASHAPFGYQNQHGGWAAGPEQPWAETGGVEHQATPDEAAEPAAERPADDPLNPPSHEADAEEPGPAPADDLADLDSDLELDPDPDPDPVEAFVPAPRPVVVGKPVGRGRRRSQRPRRSALLSVAAPSLAVLGVTAAATAATVSGSSDTGEPPPVAAPDPAEVEEIAANEQFDTQLQGLSAAVDDYADRASRTQGRMDLEAQIEAEEQAAEEEAARQEALRPKFFVPVEQHGLSAYFGQAGVNWMSTHTGIDFPVSYGTPVMAATDGEIRTQWNPSYGNMVILTAADGTETWYAHLDSTVFQSGWVQAGTVIAYSGNSGTSTGPHLHFEVRPYGGSAIDPLAWLRGKGLEPT
ncbi:peptidoglycan DD-metalloendopeptidase family protein [Streptomyces sp. 3MP-14]|uniref:Peptidoglycan DD-metalloendopeptidase family protein n=2 Tax=Streptomyces TaxID=1883 RepID=A0A5N6AHI7_9ACTN|nr:peptidoglycan DD-metalloendopeptidase family protein [Streptomyces mimosae]KAB8177264.1 peptidoglycan DD-metalloendopeptidase family protein [Streptomyces sp. 3MP-14]